ncbi:hypothetical protein SALBM311S_01875 [Streptomyces alboniger]
MAEGDNAVAPLLKGRPGAGGQAGLAAQDLVRGEVPKSVGQAGSRGRPSIARSAPCPRPPASRVPPPVRRCPPCWGCPASRRARRPGRVRCAPRPPPDPGRASALCPEKTTKSTSSADSATVTGRWPDALGGRPGRWVRPGRLPRGCGARSCRRRTRGGGAWRRRNGYGGRRPGPEPGGRSRPTRPGTAVPGPAPRLPGRPAAAAPPARAPGWPGGRRRGRGSRRRRRGTR